MTVNSFNIAVQRCNLQPQTGCVRGVQSVHGNLDLAPYKRSPIGYRPVCNPGTFITPTEHRIQEYNMYLCHRSGFIGWLVDKLVGVAQMLCVTESREP